MQETVGLKDQDSLYKSLEKPLKMIKEYLNTLDSFRALRKNKTSLLSRNAHLVGRPSLKAEIFPDSEFVIGFYLLHKFNER